MYTQLYFHPVRRVYDTHLQVFLKEWLADGRLSTALDDHLNQTDNEVMAAILAAARNPGARGHDAARRIVQRDHYRLVYQHNPDDVAVNPEAARAVAHAARGRFSDTFVYYDTYRERRRGITFPVLAHDGRIVSSPSQSDVLRQLPVVSLDYVFIAPHLRAEAETWLREQRAAIIAAPGENV
jgi:HD superfamily phosphohydrolase